MCVRSLLIAAAALMTAMPALAVPVGDPAAGEQKSQACAACHGPQGNSANAAFPRLAGQYADYLLHALRAYQSGDRENAVMAGQVKELSEQDMEDLAAFFASQSGDLHTLER